MKVWTDFLHDDKVAELSRSARLRFVELLCLAGECDQHGDLVNGDEPLTLSRIAFRLHDGTDQVAKDIDQLLAAGLVSVDEGLLSITNWDKRQRPVSQEEQREQWRERQARYSNHKRLTRESRVNHASRGRGRGRQEVDQDQDKEGEADAHSRATATAVSEPEASTSSQESVPTFAATPMADIPDALQRMGPPPRKPRNSRRLTVEDEPRLADPRVKAWLDVFGTIRSPHLAEVDAICERVAQDTLTPWQAVLREWAANGWRLENIDGMIERYGRAVLQTKHAAVPAPSALFKKPQRREGLRRLPQVVYTEESRAAATERARQQLAEREERRRLEAEGKAQ